MKSVLSFIVGLSVGAVVALLATPVSGEETRAWLSRKAEEMSEIPLEKAEQATEAAKERAGDLGSQVGRRPAEAAVEATKESILPTDKSA